MKKFLTVSLVFVLLQLCVFANIEDELPFGQYYTLDFYSIDSDFNKLDKKSYKNLSKFDKSTYKLCLRTEKFIRKNKYTKASQMNPEYLPIYFKAFQYNKKIENNHYAVNNLLSILTIIKKYGFKDKDARTLCISGTLAYYLYLDGQYEQSISLFQTLNNIESSDFYNLMLAKNYLSLGKYTDALNYANKVKKDDATTYSLALDIKFQSYCLLKQLSNANKIAYELCKKGFPSMFTAYKRVALTSSDNDIKIKYYNLAKNHTTDESEKISLIMIMGDLYDLKIDKYSKNIKGFFVKPNWNEIFNRDKSYMTFSIFEDRFKQFSSNVDNCISKYTGNDLKACFNKISENQEKYSQELVRRQEKEEELRQMRIMNANMIQANYLQQQQNYIMNRPRYYHSTTVNSNGSTSFTNGYSY